MPAAVQLGAQSWPEAALSSRDALAIITGLMDVNWVTDQRPDEPHVFHSSCKPTDLSEHRHLACCGWGPQARARASATVSTRTRDRESQLCLGSHRPDGTRLLRLLPLVGSSYAFLPCYYASCYYLCCY